jgi:hypothetical protein
MAGLSANNLFYNVTTIVAMLVGRYGLAILALALAGRFAAVSRRPPSPGTMPSDSVLFGVMLAGTALLVGALNFLLALALGPILEHFSKQLAFANALSQRCPLFRNSLTKATYPCFRSSPVVAVIETDFAPVLHSLGSHQLSDCKIRVCPLFPRYRFARPGC